MEKIYSCVYLRHWKTDVGMGNQNLFGSPIEEFCVGWGKDTNKTFGERGGTHCKFFEATFPYWQKVHSNSHHNNYLG